MSEDRTKLLDDDGDRLEQLIQMVTGLVSGVTEIKMKLTMVAGLVSDVAEIKMKLTVLDQRVESLERRVEERLYDTRPIWESVQAQIAELQAQIAELQEGQKKIVSEVRAMRIAFGRSYGDMLITQEEHEVRISKLEGKKE